MGITNDKSKYYFSFLIDEEKLNRSNPANDYLRLYIKENINLRELKEKNKNKEDFAQGMVPCKKKK